MNLILPKQENHNLSSLWDFEKITEDYWMVGRMNHPITGNTTTSLMKVNAAIEIDTVIFLTDSNAISINAQMIYHDNHLFVLCRYKPTTNQTEYIPLLIKFDLNGNEIWRQSYDTPLKTLTFRMTTTSDNHVLIYGERGVNPNHPYTLSYFVRKVNSAGVTVWEKTFNQTYNSKVTDLIEMSNGDYLFCGYSKNYFLDPLHELRIVRTDTSGQVIWDKLYNTPGFEHGGGVLKEFADGSFCFAGVYGTIQNNSSTFSSAFGQLMFIDENGEKFKQHTFQFGNYTWLNQIVPLADGAFVVRAITKINSDQVATLIKFDPNLNMLWNRQIIYLPTWHSSAFSLKALDSGDFMFVGSAPAQVSGNSYSAHAWLVKTDCFGCDSLLCYYEDSMCLVYDCNEYPTNPQFTVSNPDFTTSMGTTFTFTQNQTSNTTMRYWDLGDGSTQMGAQSITHTYTQAGTYLVKIRSHHSACYDEFEQTIVVTQNIGESYANDGTHKEDEVAHAGLEAWELDFKVYPNPAENELFIEFPNVQGSLCVVDVLGKEALPSQVFEGHAHLNLSNLSSGVYVLRIRNELGTTWFKQIVLTK